nr:unnamed protein product [Callosobruchus analis]
MSENPTHEASALPVLPSDVNVNTNSNVGTETATESDQKFDETQDEAVHHSAAPFTGNAEELKVFAYNHENSLDNDLRFCENHCVSEKPLHITADAKSVQCVTCNIEEPIHITPPPSDFDSDDDIADPSYDADTLVETHSESSASNNDTDEPKSRKRKADPKMWKKNVQKMRKHCGLKYRTKKKLIVAKTIKPPCTDSCKIKWKDK